LLIFFIQSIISKKAQEIAFSLHLILSEKIHQNITKKMRKSLHYFKNLMTNNFFLIIHSKFKEKVLNFKEKNSFGSLYDYSKQTSSGDPSDYLYHKLGFVL